MNPKDQYRLWTFFFLICLTEKSVNHHLREFKIPQKNTNELGPAWHRKPSHSRTKEIAFCYSDPGGTLENTLDDLKPLFLLSRKKSLTFQKRSKKMFLYWRANLADQKKQQSLKINWYVSRTIPSSQYETNLWSTHVNIVRLAEPIRRCVRWRTQVFKIEGFVCKRFLPSPPPPPTFIFWLLFHFSRGQNRESRSSVFLCSETKRKCLLRRLDFFSTTVVAFGQRCFLLCQVWNRKVWSTGVKTVVVFSCSFKSSLISHYQG